MSSVTIKGSRNGLTAYIDSGDFESIKCELIKKIEHSKSFFSGCSLLIVDAQASLNSDNYSELEKLLNGTYNINLSYQKDFTEKSDKAFSGIYEGRTKFIKNTVRSGQRINYNGNVVVIGDVNSGAEIIAAGNIVIMGVLRGIAHAGCTGNHRAFVAAYILQPAQLRIAEVIARAPDDKYEKPKMPEMATVKDNTILVEPYLPNKYL